MDLGSMVCTPNAPLCPDCPTVSFCKAKTQGNPESYPIRQVRKKIPHIYAAAAVIRTDQKVLITQRPPEGLLGGLWEFPNWEIDGGGDLQKQLKIRIKRELGIRVKGNELLGSFKQTFSHFKLSLSVYRFQVLDGRGRGKWVIGQKLHQFPMSRLHRKIAKSLSPGLELRRLNS